MNKIIKLTSLVFEINGKIILNLSGQIFN